MSKLFSALAAILLPCLLNLILPIRNGCFGNDRIPELRFLASHNTRLPSFTVEASVFPSGLKQTDFTSSVIYEWVYSDLSCITRKEENNALNISGSNSLPL